MSVKGVIECPTTNQSPLGGGIKFMDDSSSSPSSSSDESISEALTEAETNKTRAYLSSPAVIGYQRVSYQKEPVYGSIGPTAMPDANSDISHYKPSAVIRATGINSDPKSKRNSLELVDETSTDSTQNQEINSRGGDESHRVIPKLNGDLSSPQPRQTTMDEFQTLLFNVNSDLPLPGTVYHQPPKAADRSAAYRLAKRLFNLDGFKTTDVSKHLSKRNDFSQLVGEEFSSFFDFTNQALDVSLRQFLMRFTLLGETQERERILHHFSKRYIQCNPESYDSEDSCHTLVCALMLLNTDLHGQHILRRMTAQDFQNNLMSMNGGTDFDPNELRSLYESIKAEPIRWPQPDGSVMGLVSLYCNPPMQGPSGQQLNLPPSNLLLSQQNGDHPGVINSPNLNTSANQNQGLITNSNGHPSNHQLSPSSQNGQPGIGANGQLTPSSMSSANGNAVQMNGSTFAPGQQQQKGLNGIPSGMWNNIPANLTQPLTSSNEKTRKLFSEAGQSACLDIPGEINAKEYMRGFLARKWIKDSHGKKPILGKRSWKLYFGRLKDLVLYLYKDGSTATQAARSEENYLNQLHAYLQAMYIYQHQKNAQPNPQNKSSPSPLETTALEAELDSGIREYDPVQDRVVNGTNCDRNNNETSAASESDQSLDNGDKKMDQDRLNNGEDIALKSPINGDLTNGHEKTSAFLPKSAEELDSNSPPLTNGQHQKNDDLVEPKPPATPNILPPEAVIRIAHAIAVKVDDYKKKVNVFKLTTKEGTEYLFQVNDSKELDLWVDKLNFVAALLSAAPMASAISSNGEFHKPLLPSSYTKLNMREQLEDYQRRILELEKELSDYSAVSQFPIDENGDSPKSTSNGDSRLSRSKSEVNDCHKSKDDSSKKSSKAPARSQSIKSSLPAGQAGSNTSISSNLSIASSSVSKKSLRRKGSINWPSSQNSQAAAAKAAHNERVSYYKTEIYRYRTYARLLESELVRLNHFHMQQQQQAAMLLMRQSYYNLNAGFTPSPQRYLMNMSSNQNNSNGNGSQPNPNGLGNGVAQKSISPVAVNPFNNGSDPTSTPDQEKARSSNNKLLLRKNARQSWRQYNAAFNHHQLRGHQNLPRPPVGHHQGPSPNGTHQEESNFHSEEETSPPDSPKRTNGGSLYEIV